MKTSVFDRRILIFVILYCASITTAFVGDVTGHPIVSVLGAISAAIWLYLPRIEESVTHRLVSRQMMKDRWFSVWYDPTGIVELKRPIIRKMRSRL